MAEFVAVGLLVGDIVQLIDRINQAATGVIYLRQRCAKLQRLVEEIRSSLNDRRGHFDERSRVRLLLLKEALERAEDFLLDLRRRRNFWQSMLGVASTKLDEIEKEIDRSSALLALHTGNHNSTIICYILFFLFGIAVLGILVSIGFYICYPRSSKCTGCHWPWVSHTLVLLQGFPNFIL